MVLLSFAVLRWNSPHIADCIVLTPCTYFIIVQPLLLPRYQIAQQWACGASTPYTFRIEVCSQHNEKHFTVYEKQYQNRFFWRKNRNWFWDLVEIINFLWKNWVWQNAIKDLIFSRIKIEPLIAWYNVSEISRKKYKLKLCPCNSHYFSEKKIKLW